MTPPREALETKRVRFATWISGGILLAASLETAFYGDAPLKQRAFCLIALSTLAILQGLAFERLRKPDVSIAVQQRGLRTIYIAAFAMVVHCFAFALDAPAAYFVWAIEAVLFGIACRSVYDVRDGH